MVQWYPWPTDTSFLRDPARPGAPTGDEAINRAAQALSAGSILAHPTSTVYGLGGRPDPVIDARLARLKGRESAPLIALAADRETLLSSFQELLWTKAAERLADAFWPGPLTIVLEDGNGSTRAVRVDGHPAVTAVLDRVGGVMTSTSLNATGTEPARSREDVLCAIDALEGPLGDFGWLDAGDLPPSATSTLVRAGDGPLEILREGAIRRSTLERTL